MFIVCRNHAKFLNTYFSSRKEATNWIESNYGNDEGFQIVEVDMWIEKSPRIDLPYGWVTK